MVQFFWRMMVSDGLIHPTDVDPGVKHRGRATGGRDWPVLWSSWEAWTGHGPKKHVRDARIQSGTLPGTEKSIPTWARNRFLVDSQELDVVGYMPSIEHTWKRTQKRKQKWKRSLRSAACTVLCSAA